MSTTDYIPHQDGKFLQWVNNFINYLGTTARKFDFPEDLYTDLTAQHADFVQKLTAAEEPATRTKLTVKAKNDARAAFKTAIRKAVKEYLANNHLVTDEDREGLGIPVHKTTRTPAPVATTYPDFDVDSSVIRRLTIHFYDQGSKKSKAKPAGQHGAEIKWAILDAPPATLGDLNQSSFDTHTPFTLQFDENQRGLTVYFCLCWENTRGEKGPWSEIVSAIIP
ncbi:MAG: hypothetical protein LBS69_02425 [Prevotellaceae bacterium]|jgi:hypothetical protein|nr:hypothetical protein [Prevotellaceae bacterium]